MNRHKINKKSIQKVNGQRPPTQLHLYAKSQLLAFCSFSAKQWKKIAPLPNQSAKWTCQDPQIQCGIITSMSF